MKISNTLGEDEWPWAAVLRHLRNNNPFTSDVVFHCRGGKTVKSNLLLLSRSSYLLKSVVNDLPPYQGLVEPDGMLKIVMPDVERATVKQWIHLVHSGAITIRQERVDTFADFLQRVIMFTGECELFSDQRGSPYCGDQHGGGKSSIRIKNFDSSVETEIIDITEHGDIANSDSNLATVAPREAPAMELQNDEINAPDGCPQSPIANATSSEPMDNPQLFTCNEATLQETDEAQSNEHRSEATGRDKKLTCPECPMKFTNTFVVYQHAAATHYRKQVLKKIPSHYDEKSGCIICSQKLKERSLIVHFGARHKMILEFMDEELRRKYEALPSIALQIHHSRSRTLNKTVAAGGKEFKTAADRRKGSHERKLRTIICPECPKEYTRPFGVFQHSVISHYRKSMEEMCSLHYDDEKGCGICNQMLDSSGTRHKKWKYYKMIHLGATHKMILQFMDKETKKKYESLGTKSSKASKLDESSIEERLNVSAPALKHELVPM